jgi:hypothetical protein
MAHKSENRVPSINFLSVDKDGWPVETVTAAILFNIREAVEASDRNAAIRSDALLRVLRRIDKRLAKRVKLR